VKLRLLLICVAVAMVAAGVVVVVLVNQPDQPVAACSEIDVGFTTDELMREGAQKLKSNPQVVEPVGETKQQGYDRYRRTFADQPEVLSLVTVDSYLANVRLKPAPGVNRDQLKTDLKYAYPDAVVQDPCNVPTIRPPD
jgi:hypothetical protein